MVNHRAMTVAWLGLLIAAAPVGAALASGGGASEDDWPHALRASRGLRDLRERLPARYFNFAKSMTPCQMFVTSIIPRSHTSSFAS